MLEKHAKPIKICSKTRVCSVQNSFFLSWFLSAATRQKIIFELHLVITMHLFRKNEILLEHITVLWYDITFTGI